VTQRMDVSGEPTQILAEVVASLPVSYGFGEGAGLVVLDGGTSGWADRVPVAVAGGAVAVIVIDPLLEDADRVRAAADSAADVPVLLSETWAGNPAVEAVATSWSEYLSAVASVETHVVDPAGGVSTANLVLRQLRVLRRLGLPDVSLAAFTETPSAYLCLGSTTGGSQVLASGVRSSGSPETLEVTVTGASGSVRLRLPVARTARPATARLIRDDGGTILPTIFETAHRATFRRLAEAGGAGSVNELRAFADDIERVRAIPWHT